MTDFEKYFKSLQSQEIADITEHSHRSNLQQLLENLSGAKIKILHEPKREGKFGSPDFKVTHTESIIGYIENKKIEENLDKILKSDQIKKYEALSDNILLTNYIDWIWIKEGKIQQRETLCFLTDIENKRAKLDKAKVESVEKLIKSFFSQAPKEIADAKKLAEALAIRAKLLKDFLLEELKRQEREHAEGRLYQLYETFRTFVFHELTVDEFSDAFAQNLVYGLFLAKLNADVHTVNLYNAKKYIPSSFELIKELVNFLDELDNEEYRETKWIVEEVLTIMNNLDLGAIQETLSFTKKRRDKDNLPIKDPYVYFYEDFLAAYDKKLRESKGVYYTPPPVVNFIVRAIDDILVNTFKIKDGLADRSKVTVLDFATGTGTFLVEVLQQIFDKLPKGSGKKDLIIKEHILKNIFGFEYLIAPYTIAHLKLSQFLKDNGYELQANERLQIFLTNTLDPIDIQEKIPFLPALTEESKQAQQVKDNPILVITGNPPYSIHSKNNGEWIKELIEEYKPKDERKINIDDDYIKFIRFAQNKMNTIENGVVGIITNNSFLSGITHRKMRNSLMKTFNKIYIVNLHGNSRINETTPDGEKDENVFDIQQGVSISIFIKEDTEKSRCEVYYCDVWGKEIDKYKFCISKKLDNNSFTQLNITDFNDSFRKTKWGKNRFVDDLSFFKPKEEATLLDYGEFIGVSEIFNKYSVGIKTKVDSISTDFDLNKLKNRVKHILNNQYTRSILTTKYNLPEKTTWEYERALKAKYSEDKFITYDYRPFYKKYIFYDNDFLSRSRKEIMDSFFQRNNIGLDVARLDDFVAIVSKRISDEHFGGPSSYKMPLYLYLDDNSRIENFTKEFREYIDKYYKQHSSPEEIFGYIYAVLHSPTYRSKYAEFLKIDFPRIPFTEDKKIFLKLSALGNELIEAHLLENGMIDIMKSSYSYGDFTGKGSGIVNKPNYITEKKIGKLYINQIQYFNNVPQDIFEFYIGGYKVIDKFLKDRKGRELSANEVDTVENIIKAIAFTIDQMKKIDIFTRSWI